jgi:hypothetical protein
MTIETRFQHVVSSLSGAGLNAAQVEQLRIGRFEVLVVVLVMVLPFGGFGVVLSFGLPAHQPPIHQPPPDCVEPVVVVAGNTRRWLCRTAPRQSRCIALAPIP